MTNLEKYRNAFVEGLGVSEDQVDGLTFQAVPAWDSVGHMSLIAALEDAFDIKVEEEAAEQITTVGQAVELIKDALS